MKFNLPPPQTPFVNKDGTVNRSWYLFLSFLMDRSGGLEGLPSAEIYVGNSSNEPEAQAVSGDITITAAGVTAIGSDKVTFAKMQNIATDSLVGRDTASTGDPENILLNATLSMDGSGNLQRAALTGDVTASAGSNATTLVSTAAVQEIIQDVVGAMATDTSTVNFTYNDTTGLLTADVTASAVDHGGLAGLSDDDHTQYLLASGTRALSADWDAGSFEIRAQTFESDVVTGTAPFTIASTTVATNLNADLLDGNHGSAFLLIADIDDAPVNGEVSAPISSNWAFDHVAAADPHTGYRLESADHTHQSTGAQAGQLDHGLALTGLTDDDHTQYLLASAATDRATFSTNWTDLTDAGDTTLHQHSAVTVANEATDTTCFINFTTAATGNLQPKTNTNITFNSSTGVLTSASLVATTADINGGTVDSAIVGGSTPAAGTFTTLNTTGTATLGDAAGDTHTINGTVSNTTSAGQVYLFNSTHVSGPYVTFQISGVSKADLGLASQLIAGGSTDDFGVTVRGDNDLYFVTNDIARGRINSTGLILSGSLETGAPSGGAGAWKFGIANTVSPTSPNRTLTVDIGGTTYYIHAKTTND